MVQWDRHIENVLAILKRHARIVDALPEISALVGIAVTSDALKHAMRVRKLGPPRNWLATAGWPSDDSSSRDPGDKTSALPREGRRFVPGLGSEIPESGTSQAGLPAGKVDSGNGSSAYYENVKRWATPEEAKAIDSFLALESVAKAAESLGWTPDQLRVRLAEAERRAARSGFSPAHHMQHTVPAGYHVKGVSTLYDRHGEVRGQWVKSAADRESNLARLLDNVQCIAEPLRAKSDLVPEPAESDADRMAVYPMGDPHLGMYAWAEETGNDFDLEIAERNLCSAVDKLVELAPPSHLGVIVNLGDFFHSHDSTNRTKQSGHALDVDTRWAKVFQAGVRTLRRCIDRALEKHRVVKVINEIGNHDDNTALALSVCLASFYDNNPRVEVDTSPAPFHWVRFGKVLLGITHGNNVKHDKLPGIMAHDRAEDWGETKHRHWLVGHIHHDTFKEYPGCTVESFRTLAARDAWHNAMGYRSGRDMKLDVYHRERGRTVRHTVGVEMLGAT